MTLQMYSLGLCATTYIWSLTQPQQQVQSIPKYEALYFDPSHDLGYITFARTGFQKF